jgi:hypothetical protein
MRAVALSAALLLAALTAHAAPSARAGPEVAAVLAGGRVTDAAGGPLAGAMVTVSYGDPIPAATVWSDDAGRFELPPLPAAESYTVRARRIGWRDVRRTGLAPASAGRLALDLALERETDPAAVAAQLPANRWLALLLARIEDPAQREELKRQCTYCHQQGSPATRVEREDWQWDKVLSLMAPTGGMLTRAPGAGARALPRGLRPGDQVPADREHARLDFAPVPPASVRQAVVDSGSSAGALRCSTTSRSTRTAASTPST